MDHSKYCNIVYYALSSNYLQRWLYRVFQRHAKTFAHSLNLALLSFVTLWPIRFKSDWHELCCLMKDIHDWTFTPHRLLLCSTHLYTWKVREAVVEKWKQSSRECRGWLIHCFGWLISSNRMFSKLLLLEEIDTDGRDLCTVVIGACKHTHTS